MMRTRPGQLSRKMIGRDQGDVDPEPETEDSE